MQYAGIHAVVSAMPFLEAPPQTDSAGEQCGDACALYYSHYASPFLVVLAESIPLRCLRRLRQCSRKWGR